MNYSTFEIWTIILLLGIGTFLIRFSFLGILGGKDLPPWVLRHLRYTAVAVLPALVAPLVVWPQATGGEIDPARLSAAAVTLGVGYFTRNVLAAIVAGAGTLYLMLFLTG
ncbi:AzlD domain-containing protein [Halodurantibacterium flavum]|uniref:AzlD domain-containing protein n=1 Tax=Halodurantibacterium flavum TaxID=1382802 RepID=A0ABW4S6S0_9RHOB